MKSYNTELDNEHFHLYIDYDRQQNTPTSKKAIHCGSLNDESLDEKTKSLLHLYERELLDKKQFSCYKVTVQKLLAELFEALSIENPTQAKPIYSLFLQYFVSNVLHKHHRYGKNIEKKKKLDFEVFINDPYFFINDNETPIIYVNPKQGVTFLHTLCRYSYTLAVKTALEIASTKLDKEALQFLLRHECKDGFSTLQASCKANDTESAILLIDTAEKIFTPEELKIYLSRQNKFGFTPLIAVSATGNLEVLTRLIDAFPIDDHHAFLNYINQETNEKWTALETAINYQHDACITKLHEIGAISRKYKITSYDHSDYYNSCVQKARNDCNRLFQAIRNTEELSFDSSNTHKKRRLNRSKDN